MKMYLFIFSLSNLFIVPHFWRNWFLSLTLPRGKMVQMSTCLFSSAFPFSYTHAKVSRAEYPWFPARGSWWYIPTLDSYLEVGNSFQISLRASGECWLCPCFKYRAFTCSWRPVCKSALCSGCCLESLPGSCTFVHAGEIALLARNNSYQNVMITHTLNLQRFMWH